MAMIPKVAWRNIWRQRVRSSIVILSIALGIWAGIFLVSFSYGMNDQRTQSALMTSITHLQIHDPGFEKDNHPSFYIKDTGGIRSVLDTSTLVQNYTTRILLNGMVSSPVSASGVRIMGIDPRMEAATTIIEEDLRTGDWFTSEKKNRILIGRKLAEKLHLDVKSKLVLTFQDDQNNIVAGAFRVEGIFKTSNSRYDESTVYVRKQDLESILGWPQGRIHEFAIVLKDREQADPMKQVLKEEFPKMTIRTWKEISPELGYADEVMAQMLVLFIGIIMLALSFGIINNMLMAVLERKKELGTLMAVGMNRRKVFKMIVLETIFLGLAGAPIGMLLGSLTVRITSRTGIDIGFLGQGLESLGISTVVYPEIPSYFYWLIGSMVVLMTLLASIYPARKALKLNPIEAIRSI
ncbi:MAG: ABC transporter permease [Bacteroidota bacterium]|nr:ABC transporter permease [Bacteroidota bacterium]MDX5505169.1 ABC transporter permease [Bacteroidota bacterium]